MQKQILKMQQRDWAFTSEQTDTPTIHLKHNPQVMDLLAVPTFKAIFTALLTTEKPPKTKKSNGRGFNFGRLDEEIKEKRTSSKLRNRKRHLW